MFTSKRNRKSRSRTSHRMHAVRLTGLEALEDRRVLAPIADVSLSESTGFVDFPVQLDGTRSFDPDGELITYDWDLIDRPAGSSALIILDDSPTPTLTLDVVGDYRVQLIVNDGLENSDPVTFIVDGRFSFPGNLPPQVDVSQSESDSFIMMPVQLDGTRSSDPENEPLMYDWTLISRPAGSTAQILLDETATPTLTPDLVGDYRVELVVNDGVQDSLPVTFIVEGKFASETNVPPVADVSLSESTGFVGSPVQLDGTRSTDTEVEPLTYQWELITLPEGSSAQISNETSATATFTPDVVGDYRVQLTVNDGIQDSCSIRFVASIESSSGFNVIFAGNNATGIENLEVDGVLYNVDFVFDSADNIYGALLPDFDFTGDIEAQAANEAVIAALNSEPAVETVGPNNIPDFAIGFDVENDLTVVTEAGYINTNWIDTFTDVRGPAEDASYATFTRVT